MEKVTLTQEQADAIEEIKNKGIPCTWKSDGWEVRRVEAINNLNLDEFMKAIYKGYEVEPSIKIGDFVDIGLFGISKIAEVTGVKGNAIAINGSKEYHEFKINRVLTDEEKQEEKEYRFWKRNGRDVWELKINDIVYSKVTKTYDEVVFVFRNGSVNLKSTTPNDFNQYHVDTIPKREIKNHNFKVTCFAEDRKDVKE